MRRSMALLAAGALLLAACGGDSALSEDDFIDELTDICEDAKRDLDRIAEPEDLAALATSSSEAIDIYDEALDRIAELSAPESVTRDLDDYVAVLEEQRDLLDDLRKAAEAGDEEKAFGIIGDGQTLEEDQNELAAELGVPECGEPEETTPTTEITVSTTTIPVEVPTTVPVVTLPPTLPPATTVAPPPTTTPSGTGSFVVLDLTTTFEPPAGYTFEFVDVSPETLDLFSSYPDLAARMQSVGAANILDAGGATVATIWIGIAFDTVGMAEDWKTIDCPDGGTPRNSANGIPGIVCPGSADSGITEIFTTTIDDVGLSLYNYVASPTTDQFVDLFLAANPG
jgi:hypothetical protein